VKDAEIYRLEPCPPCKPFWVSTKTYTAQCAEGMVGEPFSATVEYKSTISQRHADQVALEQAREQALRGLVCHWLSKACQRTPCTLVGGHVVSNFDDHFTVEYVHDPGLPPAIGDTVEVLSPDATYLELFTILDVFGPGNITFQVSPSPGGSIPVGSSVSYKPIVCCEKTSTLSMDDAIDKAAKCASAQVANLCQYGDLLPIGSAFL